MRRLARMVFTVGVHIGERPTRRSVLGLAVGATAAAALGGCDLLGPGPQWRPPDPLTGLYLATVALADRYDATIAGHPGLSARLAPLRDAHRAHAQALARQLALPDPAPGGPTAPTAPAAPVPREASAALTALRTAEKDAIRAAAEVCLAAPAWRVQLIGSIAAARASHVEALA